MDWPTIRHYLHYVISLYIVFGGVVAKYVFGSDKFVYIHIYVLAGILLHWLTNNGKCFLSQYDYSDNDKECKDCKDTSYTRHLMESVGLGGLNISGKLMSRLATMIPMLYSIYMVIKKK
jgi:hypothetical protein